MRCTILMLGMAILVLFTSPAAADKEKIIVPMPTGSVKTFKFKSSKGDVTFNHNLHEKFLRNEACLPCHRVANPTPEHVSSRFEERTAHAFCRGCHREKGLGPTECHECHRRSSKREPLW